MNCNSLCGNSNTNDYNSNINEIDNLFKEYLSNKSSKNKEASVITSVKTTTIINNITNYIPNTKENKNSGYNKFSLSKLSENLSNNEYKESLYSNIISDRVFINEQENEVENNEKYKRVSITSIKNKDMNSDRKAINNNIDALSLNAVKENEEVLIKNSINENEFVLDIEGKIIYPDCYSDLNSNEILYEGEFYYLNDLMNDKKELQNKIVSNNKEIIKEGDGVLFTYTYKEHDNKEHTDLDKLKSLNSKKIIFEGKFKNNLPNGPGTYSNNYKYKGNFLNGYKHNKGEFSTLSSNYFYTGDWKYDKQEGYGTEVVSNISEYKGNFSDGVKHGKGFLKINNGNYYEGSFVEGRIEGKGKFFWNKNKQYKGSWKDNNIDGFGVMIGSSKIHKGYFKHNEKDGVGLMFDLKNEEIIVGNWIKNKLNGFYLKFVLNDNNEKENNNNNSAFNRNNSLKQSRQSSYFKDDFICSVWKVGKNDNKEVDIEATIDENNNLSNESDKKNNISYKNINCKLTKEDEAVFKESEEYRNYLSFFIKNNNNDDNI